MAEGSTFNVPTAPILRKAYLASFNSMCLKPYRGFIRGNLRKYIPKGDYIGECQSSI